VSQKNSAIFHTILLQFDDSSIGHPFSKDDNTPLNLGRRPIINGERITRAMVAGDAEWQAVRDSAFGTFAAYNERLMSCNVSWDKRFEWNRRKEWLRGTFS
jgi:hypothetical protein